MSNIDTVTTAAEITNDLINLVQAISGTFTINLLSDISLTAELPAIQVPDGVTLDIEGNGHTLSSVGPQRGLFVYGGTVDVSNLTMSGFTATGGAGGAAGGGGGAGLGGAIFVADNALADGGTSNTAMPGNVTLTNVTFIRNSAVGGAGGAGSADPGKTTANAGGGGGLGGKGGTGGINVDGGGGGLGAGASGGGGSAGASGASGFIIRIPVQGNDQNAQPGSGNAAGTGGPNGGGGGAGANTGTVPSAAAGGGGGILGSGTSGGFGGGGGGLGSAPHGDGGFGGGGGGSITNAFGIGGFGGGGGGNQSITTPGQTLASVLAKDGGFGGGSGVTVRNASFGIGAGGGGLGAGADIFVQQGASLTIVGGSIVTGTVAGGAGGGGPSSGVSATAGSALGSALFLQPGLGIVQTIGAVISDGTGASGPAVVIDGPGTVQLTATNTDTGGEQIVNGTLEVASAANLGSGPVLFSGGNAFLRLSATPANGSTLATTLSSFDATGYVTIPTLAYVSGAHATVSGTTVTLVDGTTTLRFKLATAPAAGTTFLALRDAAGGTMLSAENAAPTSITGTVAGQTTVLEAPVRPFSTTVIMDQNSGSTDTLTISEGGWGGLLAGTGLTRVDRDTYSLTGSGAEITAALQQLAFTSGQAPFGTQQGTSFTLSNTETAPAGGSFTTTDSTTTVTDSAPAVAAPTITGTVAGQSTTLDAPLNPFSGVTIKDPNRDGVDTLTIALTGGLGGTLTGETLVSNGDGTYTISAYAAFVTQVLKQFVFTPAVVAPGAHTTTSFTLTDVSRNPQYTDQTTVDTKTTVTDSSPALVAPKITGAVARQMTSSGAPVQPFSGVTITDSNARTSDTLTINLTGSIGTLSGTGLTDNGGGSYTVAGSAADITAVLDNLVYQPVTTFTNTQGTTRFLLSDVSATPEGVSLTATNSTTSVIDTEPSLAPSISGTQAQQTTSAQASLHPFATTSITDTNLAATDTLTITVTGRGGQLSSTGLTAQGGGIYTLSGTPGSLTAALQALTFSPIGGQLVNPTRFALSDASTGSPTAAVDSATVVTNIDPTFTTATVSTVVDLNATIAVINGFSSGAYTIDITSSIDVGNATLRAIALQPGVTLDIAGTAAGGTTTLGGGGATTPQRGLFVYSGAVTLQDLQLAKFDALGGTVFGNGGGGAGLGGALFVASAGRVQLQNVSFSGNLAAGGAGGPGSSDLGQYSGGSLAGLPDVSLPASAGTFGKTGSFGGGGGGGATVEGFAHRAPGLNGGFGGGGGGGAVDPFGGSETGPGGLAGFGGTPGGAHGDGGNGLAAGGDVFVQQGGTLTISGGTATSIADGTLAPAIAILGSRGNTFAPGIYLQGNANALQLDSTGTTETIAATISDDTGGAASISYAPTSLMTTPYTEGKVGVVKTGTGTVVLTAANQYTGGTTIQAGTLELGSSASAGTGPIHFSGAGTTLQLDAATPFTNVLDGLASKDVLDLRGLAYVPGATVSMSGNVLTVASGSQTETFAVNNLNMLAVQAFSDGNGGTDVACFAAGTHIRTTRGEVLVEQLQVGDVALTRDGEQPIAWIGYRTVNVARNPQPRSVAPIRVVAGAFGTALPKRDLLLSPEHCVYSHGVLVPVRFLVNGTTIRQEHVAKVTYYHVELPQHGVLFANNLPTESYLDGGNRATFSNAVLEALTPAFPDTLAALAYAPIVSSGFTLEAIRQHLDRQAMAAA